ncbi:MAG: DUF2079 domain-containing protein [Candidatus Tritonobacter lacicola]|nr:DUF2079 domain-containing protein [Candidatus Tritonobacter lacicola]
MIGRREDTGFPFPAAFFTALTSAIAGLFICLALRRGSADGNLYMTCAVPLWCGLLGLLFWFGIYLRRGRGTALSASLPYAAFLILLFFLPDYYVGKGPRLVVSLSILAITVLCLFVMAFSIFSRRWRAFEESAAKSSAKVIAAACVLFIGTAIAYGIIRYYHFGYAGLDLGLFIQSYWTTLRGKLFWNTHELYPGGSRFGKHFSPVMFLIFSFFSLCPHFIMLLCIYSICLGLGCIVVYLLARDSIGRYAGICFGVSFLLYPGIVYGVCDGYYMLHYTPLFLLLALYYFKKEKLGLFSLFIVLSLCTREDIALTTFFFGIYAALQKRKAVWVLLPTVLSAAWFGASMAIIIPAFGPGTMWEFFEDTGGSPEGVIQSIIHNPGFILARFTSPGYIKLIYLILMPLAVVLPLLGGEIIFALPTLAIIGLSSREQTRSIYGYYYLPLIPFIFAGAITTVKRLCSGKRPAFISERQKVKLLCAFVLFLSLAVFVRGPLAEILAHGISRPYNVRLGKGYNETLWKVMGLVPADASVFMPRYLMPHLAKRMFVAPDVPYDAEYLIVDSRTEDKRTAEIQKDVFIQSLDGNPDYDKLFDEKGVKLYRRK